jgi:hypothetical protein
MDFEGTPLPPIEDLVKRYEDEVFYGDERAAAEYAYALAIRLRDAARTDEAREYARRSLHYAERLPSKSLDDVSSERMSIGGVPMPEKFHDGVVRSRLSELLAD